MTYPDSWYKAEEEFFRAKVVENIDKETGEIKHTCEAVKRLESHRAKVIQDKFNKFKI
jgi:hypothetical protein